MSATEKETKLLDNTAAKPAGGTADPQEVDPKREDVKENEKSELEPGQPKADYFAMLPDALLEVILRFLLGTKNCNLRAVNRWFCDQVRLKRTGLKLNMLGIFHVPFDRIVQMFQGHANLTRFELTSLPEQKFDMEKFGFFTF